MSTKKLYGGVAIITVTTQFVRNEAPNSSRQPVKRLNVDFKTKSSYHWSKKELLAHLFWIKWNGDKRNNFLSNFLLDINKTRQRVYSCLLRTGITSSKLFVGEKIKILLAAMLKLCIACSLKVSRIPQLLLLFLFWC